MGDRGLTIYCGLLLAISAFSIDITLPFFGMIRDSLNASNEATHAIVTLNLLCLGIGQLMFGSVSDRLGRRPTLLIGLSLFLIGSLVALLSQTMTMLLVGRALQGLGGGAAPVTARAILRDRFSGTQLARSMAMAVGIFSIGPIAAPLIGVALVNLGGSWRITFVAMAVMACGLLIALRYVPETIPQRNPKATSPRVFIANIGTLFANRQSRYFLLLTAWTMVAIIIIIGGMARIMEAEYNITGTVFALLFATHGLGIIAGQVANRKLIDRFGVIRSAITAAAVMCITFTVMSVLAFTGLLNGYLLAALVTIFATGYLVVIANGTSMVMSPHGQIAGFTAAFYGFFGQFCASIVAMTLLVLIGPHVERWALALLLVATGSLLALIYWQRRGPAEIA